MRGLCIHLRLGDTALLNIHGRIVSPLAYLRNDLDNLAVAKDVAVLDRGVQRQVGLIADCEALLNFLAAQAVEIPVGLISDGYDLTRSICLTDGFCNALQARGLDASLDQIAASIDELDQALASLPCGVRMIGERGADDFFASSKMIVDCDVCVSSSRAFAYNTLCNFKPLDGRKMRFYTLMRSKILSSLNVRGVEVRGVDSLNDASADIYDSICELSGTPRDQ